MMCSVVSELVMPSGGFPRTAGLEHPEHAIGDDEAADDVAGGGHYGDGAEDYGEGALVLASQNNGADDGDGVQRVGEGHERRVQQGRDAANHFETNETRHHEDEKA